MYHSLRRALAVALAAALFAPGVASAQDEASITGTVTDATGLILPGVTVEARDDAGNTQVTFTDGTGQYSFTGLAPGTYEVTFVLPGFNAPAQTVQVSDGATATASAEMEVGLEERVVVVGTRAQPRSVTESPVPVDVIQTGDFVSQGTTDLANQLRTVVPSFNINIQPISDAATIVRPANLRNLAPDHTLILVNGKRRHRAAVITWLGNGIADGSQGPDISVIPAIAIRQAEVLRDGAAAQYGSDAIAGVMNFQLKDARQGGSLEYRTGAYRDANPGDTSTCGSGVIGDIQHSCNGIGGHGRAYSVAGNAGLPLGPNGFLNLSFEYGNANPTNRSIQRNGAAGIISAGNDNVRNPAQVWGSPLIEDDLKLFGNFGSLFENGLQFYGHTNYASRKVTGGFYFRNPHTRSGVFRGDALADGTPTLRVGNVELAEYNRMHGTNDGYMGPGCPAIPIVGNVPDAGALAAVEADPNCWTLYSRFPGGFTPQFGGNMIDYSLVTGLRGFTSTGLNWDASVNIGSTEVDQFIFDTVNASLGYDTPTSFHPGIYGQDDVNLNFDISMPVTDIVNFAAGAEWRNEQFTIGAGGEPSWRIGPYAAQGFSSGSNGFNGYRADTTAGQWSRSNIAVYGDLEFNDPAGRWTFGTAVRLEDFEDFGTTTNGKVSTRYALNEAFSLRAAVSTGFRAPTPGQQNAFNVTTAFIGGELTNQGVVPATSAVAVARGGGQLQPEKSRNYSAGAVVEQGPFTFTADFFRIDIDDRVALTQEISLSEDEIVTLLAEGIPEARNFPVFRFFVNDFSTTTQGVDVISTLGLGSTTVSAVFNYTDTELKNIRSSVIDEFRIATLEQGLPNTRWNFSVNHAADRWRLTTRVSYYGSYWDSEDGRNAADLGEVSLPWLYAPYSGKALLDVELGIPFGAGAELAIGAENLLNAYPDVNPWGAHTVGNQYGQFSPFGFNGAYYYTRVSYGWGG
ncbi:MAG: TonB-dependent receptor [Acidobacteria bacterium]|nr:TonB-dependent receptor [Acidobacteriota bacterium]MYJ05075.1 TonB-dependent receptor [Acidobacteriota bacterium]